ncbi:MAG: hypothetical protein HYZ51_01990 [Candidatus Doudnabacteria bacterium]|nr:hypothetical protein [Candidatus Doudnabacteria bacterium]
MPSCRRFRFLYARERGKTILDLSEPVEEDNAGFLSGSTRINPLVALRLFRWLLDEELNPPFRLHRKSVDKPEGREEVFYPTWREAKEQLKARKVGLRDVYFRTIRAHTRPVAAKVDVSGTVTFQRMSEAAQRKYELFVQDIGRQLDCTSVRKTYLLPGGIRIALDVPRTFNQGTFNTLEEVWHTIPDSSLKARARSSFRP